MWTTLCALPSRARARGYSEYSELHRGLTHHPPSERLGGQTLGDTVELHEGGLLSVARTRLSVVTRALEQVERQ